MRVRTKSGTKTCCTNQDIHTNPNNPGRSRIPYNVSDYVIEDFLKHEILLAQLCACPSCDARRHVLRRLQVIFKEWKQYKRADEARRKCYCVK